MPLTLLVMNGGGPRFAAIGEKEHMRMWRRRSAAVFAGVLVIGFSWTITAGGTTFVNWPRYLYSAKHTSANLAATAITPANATTLTRAWQFSPAPGPVAGLSGFLSSPAVYDGVIYIGAKNGTFYAISETTGTVIWQRFIGYVPRLTCGAQGLRRPPPPAAINGKTSSGSLQQVNPATPAGNILSVIQES